MLDMICEKCSLSKENDKACKNCKKLYDQERYKKNRNKILQQTKEYVSLNKEKRRAYEKQWYQDNKPTLLVKHRKYKKFRYDNDPLYKLQCCCTSSIYQALKSSKNGSSILDYLPYTMVELKTHLENQFDEKMSWNNYGSYWHIDHIIPQSKLKYSSMTDDNFQKCWALNNLQPLEALTNIRKQNKIG